MLLIPKYCHNNSCGYVSYADPELNSFADSDEECPACREATSFKSNIPEYLVNSLVAAFRGSSKTTVLIGQLKGKTND